MTTPPTKFIDANDLDAVLPQYGKPTLMRFMNSLASEAQAALPNAEMQRAMDNNDHKMRMQLLSEVFASGVTLAALLQSKEAFSIGANLIDGEPNAASAVSNANFNAKIRALDIEGRFSGMKSMLDGVISDIADTTKEQLDTDRARTLAVGPVGFYMLIFLLAGRMRLLEKKIATTSDTSAREGLTERLQLAFDYIIGLYEAFSLSKPASALFEERERVYQRRKAGGQNSKNGKDPLFDRFIGWALKLPADHPYRSGIAATEAFIRQLGESAGPADANLFKQVAARTPRTMLERLSTHCIENGIEVNPITRKSVGGR